MMQYTYRDFGYKCCCKCFVSNCSFGNVFGFQRNGIRDEEDSPVFMITLKKVVIIPNLQKHRLKNQNRGSALDVPFYFNTLKRASAQDPNKQWLLVDGSLLCPMNCINALLTQEQTTITVEGRLLLAFPVLCTHECL